MGKKALAKENKTNARNAILKKTNTRNMVLDKTIITL